MRHRHLSNSLPRSGIEQHGSSHTPTEQYFPTGRAVAPENVPYVGPANHMARHRNLEGRGNEFPASNVSMEVQPYVPFDPYSHSSITENRSLPPVSAVGHTDSTNLNVPNMLNNYNVPIARDVEADLLNHPSGNGGALKRKRSGSFYSAGSSSSSSQMPMEKPLVDSPSVPPYRGSLTIGGEDSSRNVRRRYRVDLEPNMTRPHVPVRSSQFYHSAYVQHTNLDANGGQWNCVPPPHYSSSSHRRIPPSDMSGSRQFHIGGSSADVRDTFFSRHSVSSSHAPPTREEHVNHSRRAESSYGNSSRYSHYTHGSTSSTNGTHTPPDNFSSRNSRHWRSHYRSGRPRVALDRFPPVINTADSHDRMGRENMMMVDRAPFYGSSRNFSDQYRDLRLDIDNMSYEELLNLEERIGIVNTGLSDDSLSKCLIEKVHCCLDQNQNELSCPICLEEYENGNKIGRMEKCGHEYHVDCVKKWLSMKKVCPICKSECAN